MSMRPEVCHPLLSTYATSLDFSVNHSAFSHTVKPALIPTEMLAFPSKFSRNQNHSDLTIGIPCEKTTPTMEIIPVAKPSNSDDFLPAVFATIRPLLPWEVGQPISTVLL